MLAHNVYFALHDASPAARRKLVEACKKYLSNHPGTVFFAAGTLCAELDREVNVRDFDVALHVAYSSEQTVRSTVVGLNRLLFPFGESVEATRFFERKPE